MRNLMLYILVIKGLLIIASITACIGAMWYVNSRVEEMHRIDKQLIEERPDRAKWDRWK